MKDFVLQDYLRDLKALCAIDSGQRHAPGTKAMADWFETRYQALAFGSAMAALAGAYLSVCYAKIFTDTLVGGRGFIAVALVYFGRWSPLGVLGGAMLFSLAQALQLAVQAYGFTAFPYEFLVMLPYVLVVVVLVFVGKSKHVGPTMLGKPFNREMRT